MSANNGGPALPIIPPVDDTGRSAVGYPYPQDGMSLRDYFAAHAPKEAAAWFAPIGIDAPHWSERDDNPMPHGWSASVGCCDKCDAYFEKRRSFDADRARRLSEYEMAKYVQWPWAYADAMIAARETK